jgi:3-oxoacyl-[acyl-carrier protein] reductase
VLLVDLDANRLEIAVKKLSEFPNVTHSVYLALPTPSKLQNFLAAPKRPIDGLIHMAGLFETDALDSDNNSTWDRAIAANLTNAYDLAVAYQKYRNSEGVGGFIYAALGLFGKGVPGRVSYSVAKSGIVGLTRVLSHANTHLTLSSMQMNSRTQTPIKTNMTQSVFEERGDQIMSTIPLQHFWQGRRRSPVWWASCAAMVQAGVRHGTRSSTSMVGFGTHELENWHAKFRSHHGRGQSI